MQSSTALELHSHHMLENFLKEFVGAKQELHNRHQHIIEMQSQRPLHLGEGNWMIGAIWVFPSME